MKSYEKLTEEEFAELVKRAARLEEAPPEVLQAAIDLWPARETSRLTDLAESAREVLHAVLSFDSWASPGLAVGLRSSGSERRQLLFSTDCHDIDLRISGTAEPFEVAGQVLGPDEGGSVELQAELIVANPGADAVDSQQDAETWSAVLDDLGSFKLTGIAAGTYRLTLHLAGDEVVLSPITVGETPA
jgi:hypothetical protein